MKCGKHCRSLQPTWWSITHLPPIKKMSPLPVRAATTGEEQLWRHAMAARSESLAKWVARAPPRGPGNAKTTALIGREPGTSSFRGVPCGCEGGGRTLKGGEWLALQEKQCDTCWSVCGEHNREMHRVLGRSHGGEVSNSGDPGRTGKSADVLLSLARFPERPHQIAL